MLFLYNYKSKHSLSFSYIIVLFLLFQSFLLISCSDSEKKLPFITTPTTKVIINMGASSRQSVSRREAAMPSDITMITVAVTADGMIPVGITIIPPRDSFELAVPSGTARRFTVAAASPTRTYSGTAVMDLPTNQTVTIPIIMNLIGTIFQNEGTVAAPVLITANSVPYVGQVAGNGKSYYYVNVPSGLNITVNMSDLTDDADIISYTSYSDYSIGMTPDFSQNYCGRRKSEKIASSNYTLGNYYFVVDGSHTKFGAAFVIKATADSGSFVSWPQGTIAMPLTVPVGLPYTSETTSVKLTNYYSAIVDPDRQYWINGYDFLGTTGINIYEDPLYTVPIGTGSFTVTNPVVFFDVTGSVADFYDLEIVANEGSYELPADLTPSSITGVQRANYCIVGGGAGYSYYRFTVDPSVNYFFTLTNIYDDPDTNNININIYADSSFENPIYSFPDVYSYEQDIGQFPSGYFYVRVQDYLDIGASYNGASFIIDARPL